MGVLSKFRLRLIHNDTKVRLNDSLTIPRRSISFLRSLPLSPLIVRLAGKLLRRRFGNYLSRKRFEGSECERRGRAIMRENFLLPVLQVHRSLLSHEIRVLHRLIRFSTATANHSEIHYHETASVVLSNASSNSVPRVRRVSSACKSDGGTKVQNRERDDGKFPASIFLLSL